MLNDSEKKELLAILDDTMAQWTYFCELTFTLGKMSKDDNTGNISKACQHALNCYSKEITELRNSIKYALNMEAPIVKYHVFTDGEDTWFDDVSEANEFYKKLCSEHANVRLYIERYVSQADVENDICEEDCVLAQGDYPA